MNNREPQALILIDIQNDYFKQGKFELVGSEEAAINAQTILNQFRRNGLAIIHIQHINIRKEASFFIPNTLGVEIHQSVKPLYNEKIIVKHSPNSFKDTELHHYLQELKITHLVIVGMMTHMCVDATVRAAKDFGYTVEVIADACATKDLTLNDQKVDANAVQTAFLAALSYFYADIKYTKQYLD